MEIVLYAKAVAFDYIVLDDITPFSLSIAGES
jgi:hypothetical protein